MTRWAVGSNIVQERWLNAEIKKWECEIGACQVSTMPDRSVVNEAADKVVVIGAGNRSRSKRGRRSRNGRNGDGFDNYRWSGRTRYILSKLNIGRQWTERSEMPVSARGSTKMHDAVRRGRSGRSCISHWGKCGMASMDGTREWIASWIRLVKAE